MRITHRPTRIYDGDVTDAQQPDLDAGHRVLIEESEWGKDYLNPDGTLTLEPNYELVRELMGI